MKIKNGRPFSLWPLLGFIVLCYAIAWLGGLATQESLDPWYEELQKPSWTPPSWLFGPVWTLLYAMIAFVGWILYQEEKTLDRKRAFFFYFLQLFFNGIWSFLFFYWRSSLWSFVDIVLLSGAVLATIFYSWRVNKIAGYFLVPYFIWVLYAAILNAAFLTRF